MKTLKSITESFKLNEETLDREDRVDIVEAMRILLGSAYSLQLKTQHYHWNIQGPDFVQYHTYLGELYEFISGHVDNIAEQIRALDSASIGTFEAFASVSEINLDESIPPALVMLNNVANDFGTMIEVLDDVNDIAEDVDAAGLANYLQDTIDQFNKKHWMLKAIQQRSLTESVNESVQESVYVNEKLKVSDGMGTWIKDFQASDAPQFKGKSDKERRDMAIAAFMSAKRNESTNESNISQQTADDNKKKMIRKAEKDKLVRLNTMLDREKQRQKARKAQLSK